MNQTRKRENVGMMSAASKGGEALAQMLAAGKELSIVNIGEGGFESQEQDITVVREMFAKNKEIVIQKGQHKDWQ